MYRDMWKVDGAPKTGIYDDMSDSEDDNEAYLKWKRARETNDQKLDKIYNTFLDNGVESDMAQEMAEERIQPCNEKEIFAKYTTLNYILPLRNNELHNNIMAQDKLITKG